MTKHMSARAVAGLLCLLLAAAWSACALGQAPATILYYASGASGLEKSIIRELDNVIELEGVEEVNVVAMVGGVRSWNDSRLRDEGVTVMHLSGGSIGFEDAGERSISDPEVLAGFLVNALRSYPADRYYLVMDNHGAGSFGGMISDELREGSGRGSLTMKDLKQAFSLAEKKLGSLHFDMVIYSACLMGTVEAAAVAQPYADYLLCSEEVIPVGGLSLQRTVYGALQDPYAAPLELASLCVDGYQEDTGGSASCVLLDLREFSAFSSALDSAVQGILDRLDDDALRELSRVRDRMKDLSRKSAQEQITWDVVDMAEYVACMDGLFPGSMDEVVREMGNILLLRVDGEQNAFGLAIGFPATMTAVGRSGYGDVMDGYSSGCLPALEKFARLIGEFKFNPEGAISRAQTQEVTQEETPASTESEIREMGDRLYTIQLSQEELDIYSYARGTLTAFFEDEYVHLGYCEDMFGDERTGLLVGTVEEEWPCLDGNYCPVDEVEKNSSGIVMQVLATIDGEFGRLEVAFEPNSTTGKVVKANIPIGDGGMQSCRVVPMREGMKLRLAYPVTGNPANPTEETENVEYYYSEEFVWKPSLMVEYAPMDKDFNLLFSFSVWDVYGRMIQSSPVPVKWE